MSEGAVRLLADLVAIPSMNPLGRDRPGPDYTEGALADFVASTLRSSGMDVEVTPVFPGRPNVVARVDIGAASTVLLEAHLDTVHADNMTIDPFQPEIRNGRLFGRGSCDTKGSLAAFMFAVMDLLKRGVRPSVNIVLLAVADEEYRFSGANHAMASGLRADRGIAGEPTQLHVVRAHKGVTRWKIVTSGRAAHSAYPARGNNAIMRMGRILVRLEEYAAVLHRQPPYPELGPPTLSVGVIEGGQAVNIVPDRCWIEIDRRTLPGETREDVLGPVRQLLEDLPDWTLEHPHVEVGGMDVPAESPAVTTLASAIRGTGGAPIIETAPYATDAGVYNRYGIPTVVFGPGDIAQAHTADESIDLDQVHLAVRIIQRTIG